VISKEHRATLNVVADKLLDAWSLVDGDEKDPISDWMQQSY